MSGSKQTVVVFDGDCRFCQRQVERIKRLDMTGRFECIAWQSASFHQRFAHLSQDDIEQGLRAITPDGRVLIGADASCHIAGGLKGWRWVAGLYRVPGLHRLAKWLYAWIAARRHRLSGCRGRACESKR